MSSVSKPRVRHNRHKQGLNLTLEKLSADFRFHTDCKNTLFFSKLQIFAEQLLKTACKGTNKRAENKRKYEVIYFAFPSESTFDEVRGTNKRAESKAKTLFSG